MAERRIGEVGHDYPKARSAVVRLEGELHVGDRVHFRGAATDFTEKVPRMATDHTPIEEVRSGQEVGVEVREHDAVYLVKCARAWRVRLRCR